MNVISININHIYIETVKFIEYDRKRSVVFLLNKEKPTQTMRLVSVKLKFELNCESDSDDGDSSKNQLKKKTKNENISEPRFEFATEVQLKLSS